MKKALVVLVAMICVTSLIIPALAGEDTWYCDMCGLDRNTPFCPTCGSQKPVDRSGSTDHSHPIWPVRITEGTSVILRPLVDKDMRHQAYFGPDKTYGQAGAYKPYKVINATALFQEGDYVLVDLDYETAGRRCVYFRNNMLLETSDVKNLDLDGFSAKTTMTLIPHQGPGYEYEGIVQTKPSPYADWTLQQLVGAFGGSVEIWEALQPRHNSVYLEKGSSITVFFQTENWAFAEFSCSLGLIRAWLPVEYVVAE